MFNNPFNQSNNNTEEQPQSPEVKIEEELVSPATPLAQEDDGFKLISLDLIDDPATPMRSDLTTDSVTELVLSIKQVGIIEPLIVKAIGQRYEVIAGHRRLFASRICKLDQIPCIVKRLGQEETEVMKVHENLYREDISPLDEAKHIDYLIQHLKLSPAKVAQLIGKSPTYVSERLAIFNYPDELRQALASKKIVFSVAREFARHPDPEKIKQFVRYSVQNGATPNMARQWVQDDIRATTQSSNPEASSSEDFPEDQNHQLAYHCALCHDPIEVVNLTVAYMHDRCHQELQKELKDSSSSEEIPTNSAAI